MKLCFFFYSWGTEIVYHAKHECFPQPDFCILIKIVFDMKALYSNVTRIAFRGKMRSICGKGQAKQTFVA